MVACVDLIDYLVDYIDRRALVIVARGLLDELCDLSLVHFQTILVCLEMSSGFNL